MMARNRAWTVWVMDTLESSTAVRLLVLLLLRHPWVVLGPLIIVGVLALVVLPRAHHESPADRFMAAVASFDTGGYWSSVCPESPAAAVPRREIEAIYQRRRAAGLKAEVHRIGSFQRPEGGQYWYYALVLTGEGQQQTEWYVLTVRGDCVWEWH